jgi:hypothetical protein
MFIAAFLITTQPWKQPRCPSEDEYIQKWGYIKAMRCYFMLTVIIMQCIILCFSWIQQLQKPFILTSATSDIFFKCSTIYEENYKTLNFSYKLFFHYFSSYMPTIPLFNSTGILLCNDT